MSEKWYRGEGVGVIPARAGGVDNDVGDGMYLTNRLEVGTKYAVERAPNVEDRRVYLVPVERSEFRVLDLTTDARWEKHIKFPLPPNDSSGRWSTIEDQLKAGTASQYKKHFENFVNNPKNNINLNDYDAVIGHEYRLGGKQMCILYKNGQPSAVQIKLRTRLVPVGALATTKSPAGALQFGGKIGPGMKIAAGSLATAAVMFLLSWLLGKLIEKQQEEDVRKKMESLQPTIEAAIKSEKEAALKLLVNGKKAFATVRIAVENQSNYQGGELGYMPTVPAIKYLSLEITETDETTPKDRNDGEKNDWFLAPGAMLHQQFYKMSLSLTFSRQEVDLYRAYMLEMSWYEAQGKTAASAQDVQRLNQDKNDLVKQLYTALAD